MRLTRISGGSGTWKPGDPPCGSNDCPTVYTTERGTVAVQGYVVEHPVPGGEAVVEIPAEVLLEAARALGR
jgi:hypothetical protein